MPFSGDPAPLLNSILIDIAKIEQFTQGADRQSFEEDDQVAYAVKYALLRISEAAHRETALQNLALRLHGGISGALGIGCGMRTTALMRVSSGIIVEKDLAPLKAATRMGLKRLIEGNK